MMINMMMVPVMKSVSRVRTMACPEDAEEDNGDEDDNRYD